MSDFFWNGGTGAFDDPTQWTNETDPSQSGQSAPGTNDTANFDTPSTVTGSGDVAEINTSNLTTFNGDFTTGSLITYDELEIAAGTLGVTGLLQLVGYLDIDAGATLATGEATIGSFESGTAYVYGVWDDSAGPLFIAYLASGDMEMFNGATVTANGIYDGNNNGNYPAIISVDAATLDDLGGLLVGGTVSYGTLEATDGASIDIAGVSEIGSGSGGQGTVMLDDADWTNGPTVPQDTDTQAGDFFIGLDAVGLMTVADGATFAVNGGLDVGVGTGGLGTLVIESGATVLVNGAIGLRVGDHAGGTGTLIVSGPGTEVLAGLPTIATGNSFDVGSAAGTATITIADQAQVVTGQFYIAGAASGDADGGTGTAVIETGATVTSGSGGIGGDGGTGTIIVDDALWQMEGEIDIGQSGGPDQAGAGTLILQDDGYVMDATGEIGLAGTGPGPFGVSGLVTVDDGTWSNTGTLTVGDGGVGTLDVIDGGTVIANDDLIVAGQTASAGTIDIDGTGTGLTVGNNGTDDATGTVTVGEAGQGTLAVSGGASVTIKGDVTLGALMGGIGSIDLEGQGSDLSIAGSLIIGAFGDGTVTVGTGATLLLAGTVSGQGTVGVEPGANVADTLLVGADGLVSGHGQITTMETGTVAVSNTTTAPTYALAIANDGTILANGGTLVLDGNLSGDGQVLVGSNATLEIGGTVADDVTVMFLPGGGQELVIDDPIDFNGTISSENFEPGNEIDLPNVPYVDPGSDDINPDGASFYFETGEDQPSYVLQVVVNDETYNIPISKDALLNGGFTLSDDGHGGTLLTYLGQPVTGYSVTADADGPEVSSYDGVVRITSGVTGSGTPGQGSGFAVGPHLILTALHVVLPALQSDGYIRIELPNGQKLSGHLGPHGDNIVLRYSESLHGNVLVQGATNDWAYVYVPGANFSPSDTLTLDNGFQGGTVDVTGYPGVLPNGQLVNVSGETPHQYEWFQYASSTTGGIKLTDPIVGGFSGGPTWIKNGNESYAVGVNSTSGYSLNVAGIPISPGLAGALSTLWYGPPYSNGVLLASATVLQTGDADTGQSVQFVLNMSENVGISGSGPTLLLNDGGTATYNAVNSTGTELEFDYTVGAGDQTANLEVTQVDGTQAVQAPGGASIDFSVLDNLPTDLSINSPLVVASIAASQTGEADGGQPIQLTLTLSAPVIVDTQGGAPTLLLNDNAVATYDAAASNPSAGTLVFDYNVGNYDETANLAITSVILPSGTTVQDAAGNNADFSAAINAATGLQVGPAYITEITPSLTIDLATGEILQLTLAMSQGVTVNTTGGSPTLSLSDGATATYDAGASNPSAGTLVFDYMVGAGDYTTDLQILGYNPNGATVTDAHGVNADLSVATQYDLALDVNAATVTNLTVSLSSGEADSGQQVTLTLTMSEPVTVDLTGGSPSLTLNDGATAIYDTAASNPSAGSLVFDDTVGATDETPSLQVSAVNLNGATINDANGNPADLSAAANFTTDLQVGPAFVTSVTPSLYGEIFTGQTDQITLAMSQGVTVDTTNGSPTLSLSDGATATYDVTASDPSAGTLVFDDTVGSGDYSADLTVLAYNPNGTTVIDANGINADFSAVATYDLGLDVNAATVTDVTSSPSSGEADSGAQVTVTLTMNEAVTVDTTNGAPTLSLSTGATATYDSAASNPSAGTLVFDYTVGAADEDPNLQIIQVNLNGATIDDTNGNAADLSAASSFNTGLQIGPVFVDSVTPSLSGDITTGQTVQLAVTMSAGLFVDTTEGAPTLSLSDGATAIFDTADSVPSSGTLVFDYTVQAGDYASGLSVVGLTANGAAITDANGVNPDFSGLAQSFLGFDVNAATVTNVTASPSSAEAQIGQQVLLTVTMSEPVTINTAGGSPTLELSDGTIATYDSTDSNPAAGALVFTYTVGAADEGLTLQIAQVNLNGATITDSNGNAADLSAAMALQFGSVVASMPCFRQGTRIATRRGQVPVEQLQIGDIVEAHFDGSVPIQWIGYRHVNAGRHPDPRKVWPVRVRAGTFGAGMPCRDLWLSPEHAVFTDGILIPIKYLIDGVNIEQVPVDQVTYYHVELPRHDVLLAENLPAESYLDTDSRRSFTNGGSHVALHPELSACRGENMLVWEALGCAPLVIIGPALEAVRTRISSQAAMRAA